MKILNIGGIPTSLGEIINYKYHLDLVKNNYDQIKIGFYMPLLTSELHTNTSDWPHKKKLWEKYLNDIGKLFFSEPPYILDPNCNSFCGDFTGLTKKIHMTPRKSELGHLLCKGTSLNLGEEYIVITTKAREMDRNMFYRKSIQLWDMLNKLSKKYKIVVLGEKIVEMRKEYEIHRGNTFGIYEQIITNIPNDRIIDLTVPALGETVADLSAIQQDCLIMKEAKCVISIGIGGNCCMSVASSSMAIGFRSDNNATANLIYNKEYPNCFITKDWARFIQTLERYS